MIQSSFIGPLVYSERILSWQMFLFSRVPQFFETPLFVPGKDSNDIDNTIHPVLGLLDWLIKRNWSNTVKPTRGLHDPGRGGFSSRNNAGQDCCWKMFVTISATCTRREYCFLIYNSKRGKLIRRCLFRRVSLFAQWALILLPKENDELIILTLFS